MSDTDKIFAGSIPQIYDEYLVPLLFEHYAADIVNRIRSVSTSHLLEIAAGTGVVTRLMASELPDSIMIIATDLNQGMLDRASRVGTSRRVEWRQADAMQMPFPDESFDCVVCQFGVMFFPDKPKAFSEVRRVLKGGGIFVFNVWDRIEENEFADTVTIALQSLFPQDPPRFLARIPHGYADRRRIEQDLASGGFRTSPRFETVTARSRAASPRIPALAFCQGTPLRNEIEARDSSLLEKATAVAEEAIAETFRSGPVEGKTQAHVVVIQK